MFPESGEEGRRRREEDGGKKSRVSSLSACLEITDGLAQQNSTCLQAEGLPRRIQPGGEEYS